jgi:hypothetical protein
VKRVGVALLSVALLVVACVIIWMLRSAHRPQDAVAARPPAEEIPAHRPLPAPIAVRSDGGTQAPSVAAEPPRVDEHGPAKPIAETLREARAQLLAAARACPQPRRALDGHQRIVFWYELSSPAGQAHVDEVELIDSDLGDAVLAQCVLDRVAAARWPLPQMAKRKLQESFNAAELAP